MKTNSLIVLTKSLLVSTNTLIGNAIFSDKNLWVKDSDFAFIFVILREFCGFHDDEYRKETCFWRIAHVA